MEFESIEKVSFNADKRKSNANSRRYVVGNIREYLRAICENLRSPNEVILRKKRIGIPKIILKNCYIRDKKGFSTVSIYDFNDLLAGKFD